MHNTYSTHQRLMAYIFLISFFIQSCSNFCNFDGKLKYTQKEEKVSRGWYDARLITHGTHFYVKNHETYSLHKQTSGPVSSRLYKRDPQQSNMNSPSHGLVTHKERSVGASVDTSIRTATKRKSESKQTSVQYDKGHIRQKSKDFQVDAKRVNSKNVVVDKSNYDGGHLVDHKFSAQGSHTDGYNYVPQHHFYNSWLKESIVKNASGYLEIPLYSPNPPEIKVSGENRYDQIPIGILLVTLANKNIQDMYYFPNNQYNYRTAQLRLEIKKDMAKKMGDIFKLKPAFHQLLLPAIIHDLRAKDTNLALQLAQEAKGIATVDNLVEGMSVIGLNDEEDVISTLASDTFHQDGVELENVLNITQVQLAGITQGQANPAALNQSFNALGQFLVNYAMRNALKSEILSTHSRIMLANIVTDFIECESEVSEQALDKVNEAYGDVYQEVLEELWKTKAQMSLTDIIYLANLYQKLASDSMHHLYYEGHEVLEGMDFDESVLKFIEILKELYSNQTKKEKPNIEQMQNLVSLFIDAQASLSYIITNGVPTEELEKQRTFLKSAKKKVKEWNKLAYSPKGSYQTSPNSATSYREIDGFSEEQIEFLGTTSSPYYENEED